MSAYVSIRLTHLSAVSSLSQQHTSAYVSIRQHMSASDPFIGSFFFVAAQDIDTGFA
jgi:hypothetical protein